MSSPAAAAAGAGQSGGDAGQNGAEAQQGQAQGGLDPAAINSALEALQGGQEEMRALMQHLQQGEQGGEPEPQQEQAPDVDLSFLDDPSLDPAQMQQQFVSEMERIAERRAEQMVEQRLKPITERLDNREQQEAAAEFVQEFQEVGDPKVAKEVMELSRDYAAQLGMPELGNNYRFARLVYAATKGLEQAAGEGSDDPGAAHVEGGGGAVPASSQQQDLGDLIVKAGKGGRSVLPFQ